MAQARDLEEEFRVSVRGQAREAKAGRQRYFQVVLSLYENYQVWSLRVRASKNRTTDYGDQGAVLSDIAEEGWSLIHVSATFVDQGSITKSRIIGFGEQTTQKGGIFALYIFEATEEPPKTDRLWEGRG